MNNIALNDMQQLAVDQENGALLILAGAGSGKTRVITQKIVHLIQEKGVLPYEILAITFTNKAAKEMKDRVHKLIGEDADRVWISTFHAFCVRVLRRYADKVGYGTNFTIYDTGDKTTLIKECIKELAINKDYYKPAFVGGEISRAKDNLISAKAYEDEYYNDFRLKNVASVYKMYQERLEKNNAMDFDDLIFKVMELFEKDKEVLAYYQNKFRYIMVDEYQDTSYTQYKLVKSLSQVHQNICVVGDDDQSIYTWRGADIRNILEFEKDFENAKVIKLEQNYRSTSNIIAAANSVIENNNDRKKKHLWTQNTTGEKVTIYRASDERFEARYVVENILKLKREYGYKNSDFAVLYRMNTLSRKFEENLVKEGLNYRVFGGFKFFDRAEIKDIIAYLRLIDNPYDDVSLRRIINTPKRGIGATTVEKIAEFATQKGISMLEVIDKADSFEFTSAVTKKLKTFSTLISSLVSISKILEMSDFLQKVIENTGYQKELEAENTVESRARIDNIQELFSVVAEFERTNEDKSLSNFLMTASLSTDMDDEKADDYVSLMTIHSAKGLEFKVVFLVGAEDGIFPSKRSIDDDNLEEERRLCYVAITRAEQKLFISHCELRMLYGRTESYIRSRFIDEVNENYTDEESDSFIEKDEKIIKKQPVNDAVYSLRQSYIQKHKLEKKQKEIQNANKDFSTGSKVKHQMFGVGQVIAKQGDNYTIVFEKVGVKKINPQFVKLEQVE